MPKYSKEHRLFLDACKEFRKALVRWESGECLFPPPYPAALRVKDVGRGIWELTWAGDGRATWRYAESDEIGKVHIVWRQIGGHEIFVDP